MGRGRSANTKLKKLTEEYHAHYERADRVEKMAISQIIYQRVTESGARFLLPPSQLNYNQWVQLSETEAQTRISHGFRNLRKSLLKAPRDVGTPNMPSPLFKTT